MDHVPQKRSFGGKMVLDFNRPHALANREYLIDPYREQISKKINKPDCSIPFN